MPRAWVRARRTILSADAVSFLAAAILYLLAVGDVKGFAFTLGLSTVLDLVVVFLFTHPLVTLLARNKSFGSRRISGLGRVDHRCRSVPPAAPTASWSAPAVRPDRSNHDPPRRTAPADVPRHRADETGRGAVCRRRRDGDQALAAPGCRRRRADAAAVRQAHLAAHRLYKGEAVFDVVGHSR